MQCIDGIQKSGRGADAVEGADELASDIRAFPDPGENQLLPIIQYRENRGGYLGEVVAEPGAGLTKGFRFDVDAASTFGDYFVVLLLI